jgi:hypothetical protein
MNTKHKENQKNQRPGTRHEQRPKKQGQSLKTQQDHEHPETRMTR